MRVRPAGVRGPRGELPEFCVAVKRSWAGAPSVGSSGTVAGSKWTVQASATKPLASCGCSLVACGVHDGMVSRGELLGGGAEGCCDEERGGEKSFAHAGLIRYQCRFTHTSQRTRCMGTRHEFCGCFR